MMSNPTHPVRPPARPEVSAAALTTTEDEPAPATEAVPEPPRELSAIAKQALAEAAARREAQAASNDHPRELGGRQGPDPVRYGDWENGGIASDF
jgi:hypothetical protein